MVEYAGMAARRQGVNGLHVHVGMPERRDAACTRSRARCRGCPVVLALSANSPYLAGADTGFASNRAIVLAELPRSGAPPPFATLDRVGARTSSGSSALALTRDYTALWWDVRPHPRFGTLEVRDRRPADQSVERTAAFVALAAGARA